MFFFFHQEFLIKNYMHMQATENWRYFLESSLTNEIIIFCFYSDRGDAEAVQLHHLSRNP